MARRKQRRLYRGAQKIGVIRGRPGRVRFMYIGMLHRLLRAKPQTTAARVRWQDDIARRNRQGFISNREAENLLDVMSACLRGPALEEEG